MTTIAPPPHSQKIKSITVAGRPLVPPPKGWSWAGGVHALLSECFFREVPIPESVPSMDAEPTGSRGIAQIGGRNFDLKLKADKLAVRLAALGDALTEAGHDVVLVLALPASTIVFGELPAPPPEPPARTPLDEVEDRLELPQRLARTVPIGANEGTVAGYWLSIEESYGAGRGLARFRLGEMVHRDQLLIGDAAVGKWATILSRSDRMVREMASLARRVLDGSIPVAEVVRVLPHGWTAVREAFREASEDDKKKPSNPEEQAKKAKEDAASAWAGLARLAKRVETDLELVPEEVIASEPAILQLHVAALQAMPAEDRADALRALDEALAPLRVEDAPEGVA